MTALVPSGRSSDGRLESNDVDARDTDEPTMTLVEWERWALHKLALNQFSREQIAAADQHCKRLGELLGAPSLAPLASRLGPETEPGHTRRSSPAS
jgi:hypothetical protein